jgi:thiamine-phosphate pyrophosphorylase
MMGEDFKLIIITPEEDITNEAVIIHELFKAGLQLLHIRKPLYNIQQTRNLLNSIPVIFHSKIVIHSYYEFLHDFNLNGIHLSEKTRKEGTVSGMKNIVSTSFHNLEDIKTEKMNFKYAFLSPVFPSVSKQGYKPIIETGEIKNFFHTGINQIRFPIIALGGITDKNVLQLKDMGFNGVASIGYIWESSNPVEQFNKLQNILRA